MKIINNIILIILISLLQGCILASGIGEIGTATYTSDHALNDYQMPKKDSTFAHKNLMESGFSMKDVEDEWGKPDEILNVKDDLQIWKYNNIGLMWRGFILVFVLPIPIAVPVGHEKISFSFKNGKFLQYTSLRNHWCVSMAGLILIPGVDGPPPGFLYGRECSGYIPTQQCDFLLYDSCSKINR